MPNHSYVIAVGIRHLKIRSLHVFKLHVKIEKKIKPIDNSGSLRNESCIM